MKNKPLLLILKMTKYTLYGFLFQMLILNVVLAHKIEAQKIDEVYVSISFEEEKLVKVLQEIEIQSEFHFTIHEGDSYLKKKVSISSPRISIEDALKDISRQTGLSFQQVNNNISIRLRDAKVPHFPKEDVLFKEVKGKVTDENGEPIPGATVQVQGTTRGTVTDIEGKYSIDVDEGDVLVFSFLGYEKQNVAVGSQSIIDVSLVPDTNSLKEVVVVGYGSVRKSDLTGAVASISSEDITQVNAVSNLAQTLQGQSPGVQVSQSSGQPGDFMRIKVRGTNSLGAGNDPLYVVDGLPLDGLTAQFNPEDIASISVLKDASATAIYGSRGANGVIMITTKKGKSGKAKVSYSAYYGMQSLRKKIDVINAAEFAQLQNEVAQNDGVELPWTQDEINALGSGTDWQDLTYRKAPVQSHDLSISGGNEKTKYYSSFGYFNQEGIIRNSGFERMSFRTNIDHSFTEKLSFNTSFSIQNSKYNQAQFKSADGGGGIPFTTMVMPPTQGVYAADGTYTRFTGVPWGQTNPVGLSDNWHNNDNNLRIIGNGSFGYEFVEGLKLKLSAGLDNGYNRSDIYYPSNISLGQRSDADGNPIFGVASKAYSNSATFINENVLEYNKTFGLHNIIALGGISYQSSRSQGLNSGNAIGFLSDIYENNSISSAVTKALPSSSFTDNKLMSYYGRFNYVYANKYYVTLTGRYDGSSRFSANNKYAFFPSGAVAWTLSEEEFLKSSDAISYLKLRASYGASGNQAIGNYQTLANLSSRDVVLDNQLYTGFVLSTLENPNLKWETTKQFDIGVDLGFFNDKLLFEADYYNKKTSDLLLNVTLPGSGGFSSVLQNVGVVQNRGFEFMVSTENDFGNVHLSSSLNLTRNRTKVLDLGSDAYGNPITFKTIGTGGNWFPTIVGQSMMQLYGYTVEGVYQTDQEAIDNGEPSKGAGDYRFKNWDGEGVVNDTDDRTVLTSLEPKFTFGFNNRLTYKAFDMSILLVGSYGNDIVNEFRKYNLSLNGKWTPTKEFYNSRWQGEGSSNTSERPSSRAGSSVRDYANSLWVEDGSYLRVRDITLGYTFKPTFLSQGSGSIRVYISAQNYLTFTKYSGYDPEVSWAAASINGWDRGNYPASKSITGGLKVNF
ncbi:TonB-dependent receptor [Echinicola salinicaeni]|uniref:TonB-dependent receptor n=1 Tax=Echinicola salinicaeni TaxID=2762757 RepID=UPI001C95DC29|nr:TonB-dependent receptor [Echinicola salinicaeni]